MTNKFKTFDRVVETGNSSEILIATGLVKMDPREDHVRQRLVDLPVFHGAPAVQTTFFLPDGVCAPPMIAWDLTLVPESKKTILKITGQTIDAQPVKGVDYFCYYSAMGLKPQGKLQSGRETIVLDSVDTDSVDTVAFETGAFAKPPVVIASVQIDPFPGRGHELSHFDSASVVVSNVTEISFNYRAQIGKIPRDAKAYVCWIATESGK